MITKENIFYQPCEIEELQNLCKQRRKKYEVALSMREFLAKKNANQIWGNGFTFESEQENIQKAFEKFSKDNRLAPTLKFIERELSLHGRVIVSLFKTKGNNIKLNIANPFFYSAIGKTFVNENLAVLWSKIETSNNTFFVKSIYDRQKVVNELYSNDNKMLVLDEMQDIANEYQIEKVWYHNLGFVPVVELTNYPYFDYMYNVFSPHIYYQIADWYNSTMFEPLFYELICNLKKETKFNHSRIAIDGANQYQMEQINKKMKDDEDEDILGDYIIQTEAQSKASAIPGVGDFTKYTSAMNDIMDFYFKFANSSRFSEGTGAQKTSAEADSANNATVETLEAKINHREFELSILIAKILGAMGLYNYNEFEDYPFKFKIVGNVKSNDNAFVDRILKEVQAGTMSLVEAISQLRGISLKESEQVFENIKEFNEENNVVVSSIMGPDEMQGFSSDGFDEGGRPSEGENVND